MGTKFNYVVSFDHWHALTFLVEPFSVDSLCQFVLTCEVDLQEKWNFPYNTSSSMCCLSIFQVLFIGCKIKQISHDCCSWACFRLNSPAKQRGHVISGDSGCCCPLLVVGGEISEFAKLPICTCPDMFRPEVLWEYYKALPGPSATVSTPRAM